MLDRVDSDLVSDVLSMGDRLLPNLGGSSRHTVVAGIRSRSGRSYFGVNCDGIHGTCAEIVAYANAVLAADADVETVVAASISASDGGRILAPCGNCRQILSECAPNISVVVSDASGLLKIPIVELLPRPYKHSEYAASVYGGESEVNCGATTKRVCQELPGKPPIK